MKKQFKFLLTTLFILVVSSCASPKLESTTLSSESKTSETLTSETTKETSTSSETLTTKETSTSSITSESTTSTTTTTSEETLVSKTYSDYSGFTNSYKTGNYGTNSKLNLGFYRTYSSDKTILCCLLKNTSQNSYVSDSAIFNLDMIKGISKIEINYKSDSSSYILSSLDKSYSNKTQLASSQTYQTSTIRISKASYFKICATTSNLYIKSLTIYYDNLTEGSSSDLNYDGYKLNLEDSYSSYDSFLEGETRTIPNSIKIENGKYEIESVSVYTYHTLSYAESHLSEANTIALTDPVDVANYYMLFHTWPANYALKKSTSEVEEVFGSNARQVSSYTRTDGYATSVPWNEHGTTGLPLYYELDLEIDMDGYSLSNRGVGRLVVFVDGISGTNYDNGPSIFLTYDHYYSFMEYSNYGIFNAAFDATGKITGHSWNSLSVLTN